MGRHNTSLVKDALNDAHFLRYHRQISVEEIGNAGQTNLSNSHVLIIGCGGLGSAAGLYLASAGIGKLVLVDDDIVELSNLQRQVVYRNEDINSKKVEAMASQLSQLNPNIGLRCLSKRLDKTQLALEVMLADVVLDCSDNLETRHLINAICFENKTPLISGSATGWQGQFAVFDHSDPSKQLGCYRCLFPFDDLDKAKKCSEIGVIGPVVGIIGNYQALSAIQKIATGTFCNKKSVLHCFDGLTFSWSYFQIGKDPVCSVCGQITIDETFKEIA